MSPPLPGWLPAAPPAHDRPVRRALAAVVVCAGLVVALGACSDGDSQGRQGPELRDLESKVSQLRLEVQHLREEVQSLRDEVASVVPTTGSLPSPTLPPTTASR